MVDVGVRFLSFLLFVSIIFFSHSHLVGRVDSDTSSSLSSIFLFSASCFYL